MTEDSRKQGRMRADISSSSFIGCWRAVIVAAVYAWGGVGGCAPVPRTPSASPENSRPRWLVIAPHPDDEALMGSGVLLRAVQSGADVAVVIMTNGDYGCLHDGIQRETESVAALSALGVSEERIYFLGYPDGGLAQLGRVPLPPRRRRSHGSCSTGNMTYGAHGFGRRDYHTVQFGGPAPYTRENAVADLASLLARLRPTDVIVTHPSDTHPDHAAAYVLFRTALDRVASAPRVHRAMVHNGDCWPTGLANREPCPAGRVAPEEPTPALSGRLSGYSSRERLKVPVSCLDPDRTSNPKLRAIAAYASQTRGSWESYLFSFARSDEMFFPESFTKTDRRDRWQHAHGASGDAPIVITLTSDTARTIQARSGQSMPQDTARLASSQAAQSAGRDAGQSVAPAAVATAAPETGPTLAPAAVATAAPETGPTLAPETVPSATHNVPLAVLPNVPLSLSADLMRPKQTEQGRVARMQLLVDPSGSYVLTVDADRLEATLDKASAAGPLQRLQEWVLPHDLWQAAPVERIAFMMELMPEDGGVAELTLWCRDELVGVAIDVHPRLRGERLLLSNVTTPGGTLTLRNARGAPSHAVMTLGAGDTSP